MSFDAAVKLLLVSFDSTMRANLSVGFPLDLQIYEADSFHRQARIRIEEDDPYFRSISAGWGGALRQAFESLPDFDLRGRSPA
jgi:putative proteasome-type protease